MYIHTYTCTYNAYYIKNKINKYNKHMRTRTHVCRGYFNVPTRPSPPLPLRATQNGSARKSAAGREKKNEPPKLMKRHIRYVIHTAGTHDTQRHTCRRTGPSHGPPGLPGPPVPPTPAPHASRRCLREPRAPGPCPPPWGPAPGTARALSPAWRPARRCGPCAGRGRSRPSSSGRRPPPWSGRACYSRR